ncbi:MAG: hypothetical protein IKL73_07385 [Lachnospiraceae bacterium]|nr:hypothetical protein [Lachnospiraceae bacterium]
MDVMANKTVECSLDDGVQVVLNMLDKVIDEHECGEFIEEDELFKELANIK